MNINTNPAQNKYGIYEINCTDRSLILRNNTNEVALNYSQVTLQIALHITEKETDPLEALQNTFNETSATETFHSFRTFRTPIAAAAISSIVLTFSVGSTSYTIPMEGLFDLLLEVLKEKHPFAKISYTIVNDKPENPVRLKYIKKITTQLDEILPPVPATPQPTAPTVVPVKTSSKKWLIPVAILASVAILLGIVLCFVK